MASSLNPERVIHDGTEARAPSDRVDSEHAFVIGGRPVRLRGRSFVVLVVSSKLPKTATVEREYRHYLPKYERYTQRRKKICVHNPPEINAKEGDRVRIIECRPISKTKRFVIVEKVAEKAAEKDKP